MRRRGFAAPLQPPGNARAGVRVEVKSLAPEVRLVTQRSVPSRRASGSVAKGPAEKQAFRPSRLPAVCPSSVPEEVIGRPREGWKGLHYRTNRRGLRRSVGRGLRKRHGLDCVLPCPGRHRRSRVRGGSPGGPRPSAGSGAPSRAPRRGGGAAPSAAERPEHSDTELVIRLH
jgi:hypothetical protein